MAIVSIEMAELLTRVEQTKVQIGKLVAHIGHLQSDAADLENYLKQAGENISFLSTEAKIVSLNEFHLCKSDVARAKNSLRTIQDNIRVYLVGVSNLNKEIVKMQKEIDRLTPKVLEFRPNAKK